MKNFCRLNGYGNFLIAPAFKGIHMNGKPRSAFNSSIAVSLLVVMAAFWGAWSFAYHRGFNQGYDQGGRDEFVRWKQEPTRVWENGNRVITGHRSLRPEQARLWVSESAPYPVNSLPVSFSATSATRVSASGDSH